MQPRAARHVRDRDLRRRSRRKHGSPPPAAPKPFATDFHDGMAFLVDILYGSYVVLWLLFWTWAAL
jgi:hypothetical protein